jgi:DnaJ-class molecular chaperone
MREQINCPKCHGGGYIARYGHTLEGICFRCNGSGKINKPRERNVSPKKEQPAKTWTKEELDEAFKNAFGD